MYPEISQDCRINKSLFPASQKDFVLKLRCSITIHIIMSSFLSGSFLTCGQAMVYDSNVNEKNPSAMQNSYRVNEETMCAIRRSVLFFLFLLIFLGCGGRA